MPNTPKYCVVPIHSKEAHTSNATELSCMLPILSRLPICSIRWWEQVLTACKLLSFFVCGTEFYKLYFPTIHRHNFWQYVLTYRKLQLLFAFSVCGGNIEVSWRTRTVRNLFSCNFCSRNTIQYDVLTEWYLFTWSSCYSICLTRYSTISLSNTIARCFPHWTSTKLYGTLQITANYNV